MDKISAIGIDIAKNVFQLHGIDCRGHVLFRRKVSRSAFLKFLGSQPSCTVAMESCATSNYWGREIEKLGHQVRLIPPAYVKPFVKRHKNDMADAEAIAEAAVRPNMRFVEVKTEEQQSHGMTFRTRDLLVRQRTQLINALRGHMAEFGLVAAKGPAHIDKLQKCLLSSENSLPSIVHELAHVYCQQIDGLSQRISQLEKMLKAQAAHEETTRRLQTMPGLGPVTAMAIHAFAPGMENFKRGGYAMIPMRKNRKEITPVDDFVYGLRNQVERCFNKLKNARRVATRYDKTMLSFLGFAQVTSIRMWVRHFVNRT